MKKIAMLLSLLLIGACGKPGQENQPNEAERRKDFDKEFAQFLPKKDKDDADKDDAESLVENILPAENLFKIIEAVPEQTTTWSCGLVSSRIAQASSYLSMGQKIKKQGVAKCNEVGDYPLLVNVEIQSANLHFAQVYGLPLEGNYFRVGAAPQKIPSWLNAQLAQGIYAHYQGLVTLDTAQLVKMIDESIAINMPLMVLYVVNATAMILHYVNIVGYKDHGNTLVILDTTGKGIKRMRTTSTADFITSMDTAAFKQNLINMLAARKDEITQYIQSGELPDLAVINGIGRFNLISFKKS